MEKLTKEKLDKLKELIESDGYYMFFYNLEDFILNSREADLLEDEEVQNVIKTYKKGQFILWKENPMGDLYYIFNSLDEVFEKLNEDSEKMLCMFSDLFYNL